MTSAIRSESLSVSGRRPRFLSGETASRNRSAPGPTIRPVT